jgi:hypothetical protein
MNLREKIDMEHRIELVTEAMLLGQRTQIAGSEQFQRAIFCK